MQTALTHRLAIFLNGSLLQKDFTKTERIKWLDDVEYILSEIQEDIISEGYLSISRKNLMINIKDKKDLTYNNFSYKNRHFFYKDKKIAINPKNTFEVTTRENDNHFFVRIISKYFSADDITVKVRSRIPFWMRTVENLKEQKKFYYIEGHGEFNMNGCILSFKRKKPYNKKKLYIYFPGGKAKIKI